MTDPHALRKIRTCTALSELQALAQGWRSRGVTLTPEEERAMDETMERLVREGRG